MWITFWVIVRTNQIFVYIILFWNKQELMNIPKVTIHNEVFTFGSTSSCQTSDSWHKQKSCWLSQNNTLLYTSWEIMRCRRILNYYHLGTKKESKSLVSSFLHEKIRAKAGKERLKNSSHVHPNGVGPRSVTLPKKAQK